MLKISRNLSICNSVSHPARSRPELPGVPTVQNRSSPLQVPPVLVARAR